MLKSVTIDIFFLLFGKASKEVGTDRSVYGVICCNKNAPLISFLSYVSLVITKVTIALLFPRATIF